MATVKITVKLDEIVNEKLKAIAKADGRSAMRYVEKLIEAHVAKLERAS